MKEFPKISFIIPTLNAAWILPKCLEAIRTQNYPQENIEIIIADGGSIDKTLEIARKYRAKIITNPEILHEPGKARAMQVASGKVFFFTDADNILATSEWLDLMIFSFQENPEAKGLLPQTIPAQGSNTLDRYLGYLSTDPFTWFVYSWAATPRTYGNHYPVLKKTANYIIYQFSVKDHPLAGTSQGFGVSRQYQKNSEGRSDDILAAIKMISSGGVIVYVPKAGIYHYHVRNLNDFINKYTWRIRNNFFQRVKGMGLVNRQKYLNTWRRIRQVLFLPYAFSLFFPIIDSCWLFLRYKDRVVFWHPFASLILASLIIKETLLYLVGLGKQPGVYGK